MAYNTRELKRALDGPAPQHFDDQIDDYSVLKGTGGASWVIIYGPDGKPASLAEDLAAVKQMLTDGTAKGQVTLSGNIMAPIVVAPREVRTADFITPYQYPPDGVRGFSLVLVVYGITGTFGANQGVNVMCQQRTLPTLASRNLRDIRTAPQTTTAAHHVLHYPLSIDAWDHAEENYTAASNRVVIPLPICESYVFTVRVAGAFESGQGVDCSLHLTWLF